MVKRPLTVSVKRRALVARISRALAKQKRELRTDRSDRQLRYLVIDEPQARIQDLDVSLEALGRELGVLKPWEKLSDD
jgi:hypothetical protein